MYNIDTNKIIRELKLAIIADLHFGSKTSKRYLNKIIKKVIKISPNYILMPGDIIDSNDFDSHKKEEFIEFLKELRKISKVIMSLGNHDISHFENDAWIKKNNYELFNEIDKISNIEVLNNDFYYDERQNVCFAGYTEPYENFKYFKDFTSFKEDINLKLPSKFDHDSYNILLSHNPVHYNKLAKEYVEILKNTDLIISGHMHAGLIHPLLRPLVKDGGGLISPDKRLFPKKTVGQYKLDEIDHIIASPYTYIAENNGALRHFNHLYPNNIDKVKIKSR